MRNESAPLIAREFRWWRPHPDYIAPLGKEIIGVYSLDNYSSYVPDKTIYRKLAELAFEEDLPPAVYGFVKKWGFLGVGCNPPPRDLAYAEQMSVWCRAVVTVLSAMATLSLAKNPPKQPPLKKIPGGFRISTEWLENARVLRQLARGRLPNRYIFDALREQAEAPSPEQPPVIFFDGKALGTPAPPTRKTKATAVHFWPPLELQGDANFLATPWGELILQTVFSVLKGLQDNCRVTINPFISAPYITVYPQNLLGLIYLGLIEDFVAAYFPKGRYCPECGALMPNPRLNKTYCSVRCRNRACRQRKKSRQV